MCSPRRSTGRSLSSCGLRVWEPELHRWDPLRPADHPARPARHGIRWHTESARQHRPPCQCTPDSEPCWPRLGAVLAAANLSTIHVATKIYPKFVPKFSCTLLYPISPDKWLVPRLSEMSLVSPWGLQFLQCLDMGDASVGCKRGVGGWGRDDMATSAAWPAQRIKTTCSGWKLQVQVELRFRIMILLFVSWNMGQQRRAELQRRLE